MGVFIKNLDKFIGSKYNRLSIIAIYRKKIKNQNIIFCDCLCDCGKVIKSKLWNNVKENKTTSCGCFRNQQIKKFCKLITASKPEAKSNNKFYKAWAGMVDRCHYKKHPQYTRYGGRGITVCEEWRNFDNFLKWCTENPKPEGTYSLDRIDNDQGYFPTNCRWATKKQQANNRRDNKYYIRLLDKYCSNWREREKESKRHRIKYEINEELFKNIEL